MLREKRRPWNVLGGEGGERGKETKSRKGEKQKKDKKPDPPVEGGEIARPHN